MRTSSSHHLCPKPFHRNVMAADDIGQLADALSRTHVGDGELSYQGRGLKLDHAESGGTLCRAQHLIVFKHLVLVALVYGAGTS